MKNNTKRAIKAFKNYLAEIDNITDSKTGNTWKAKVGDTLVLYLGKESSLVVRLENLHFTDKQTHVMDRAIGFYDTYTFNPANKENFKNLINSVIHYIEHNGVEDDYLRTNFLSQFNTVQILGGILIVGNIVFWSGSFLGSTQKDREIMKMENFRDRDSIKIVDLQSQIKLNSKKAK